MAITYVGGQTAARANASIALSVTFALTGGSDATPQADDLVIVCVTVASQATNPPMAITTPSGYTALGQLNQTAVTGDTSLNVSYKRQTATPDTTVTIPPALNNQSGLGYTIQVFRGVDATTPLDVTPVSAGGTGTARPDPGAITPLTTGAWIVICGGGCMPSVSPVIYTAPADYSTNFLTTAAVETNSVMVGSGYRTWVGGTEDPATYTGGTTGANDSWCAYTLALRPVTVAIPEIEATITSEAPLAESAIMGTVSAPAFEAVITSDAPLAESLIIGIGPREAAILSEAPVPESIIRTSLQFLSVYAEVDLNDRASYYGGYKAPLVLQFLGARRGMSDRNGEIEHLQFGATLSDTSGQFRGLLASSQNKYLLNRPLTQRVITDAARRLEQEAWIVANGFVSDYAPLPRRQFKIIGQDWLKRKFQRNASAGSAWQPRVRVEDFPNANNTYQQNIGRLIPIIYGRITDTNLYGSGPTEDWGDGQLLPIYGGDTVLLGQIWAIGIIAAHHCDYLEAGFMNPGAEFGVDLDTNPDWLTPRSADWAAAGFTRPYQTINGRDYFVIYVKGDAGELLRTNTNIADPHIAVNVWGRTDTGDELGTLLTDGFDIYYDFLLNYVCPDTPWVSGAPLPMPTFPPSVGSLPYVDLESFQTCQATAASRLAGGYPLNFALGAQNTSWSLQDVIAEFNKCLDCEAYINHYGAYALTMEPDAIDVVADPLTDVLDIVADGLTITDRMRDFWNVVPFRHTFDYCGRMQRERSSEWRSEMSGDLERRHELSISRYEQERSQLYEFHFIRGKNRSTDSDYYLQGTASANDIATRLVARYANPRRAVQITTSLNGLLYDIGDVIPVSAQDGIGVNGWTDRHIRITGHEVLASIGQVVLDGYDFDAVLEAAAEDLAV